jgi:ABC-type antimicrobial peptide transport system permease subunit
MQNIVGIIGLSVGFLCFSICLFDIEWKTGYDTEYPGAKRMYSLSPVYRSDFKGNIYNLPQIFPGIGKMTFMKYPENAEYSLVDSEKQENRVFNFFECDTAIINFFSLKILAGSEYAIYRTVNSLVLFETTAKKLDKNIRSLIGKTMKKGDVSFQITGIVKAPVNTQTIHGDGFIVNSDDDYFRQEIFNKWNPNASRSFIMIDKGVSVEKFKETLSQRKLDFEVFEDRLGMTINPDGSFTKQDANAEDERFAIVPLNNPAEDVSEAHYIGKFLVGLLILLTTLFNYISFQTTQFYNRLKECALRKMAGAGKQHLFYLFFTEIIIAFVITYLISILLLDLFGNYIRETGWMYIPNLTIMKIRMLTYMLFVLALAFLSYLIPINTINRLSVRTIILGISAKGKKGITRMAMLFVQLGILFMFLSAFMIVALQMNNYKTRVFNHLPDETKKHIVYTPCFGENFVVNESAIIKEISESPFVKDVMANERLALDGSMINLNKGGDFGVPDYHETSMGRNAVNPVFFRFFECELLDGQFFTGESSPNDVVVDETFASYYKDKSPVGESFGNFKIVGVIKNLNTYKDTDRFMKKKYPVHYCSERKQRNMLFYVYVKAHVGKVKEVRQVIEETIKKFSPPSDASNLIHIVNLHEEIEGQLGAERALFKSMQILFIISLVICLLGIYSAIVMNTEKRRKEIALRKINGATIKDIILLFSKTYLGLWTIACIAFCPVVYYFGNKWLENYLDRISLNIVFFAAIYFIILILVILTIIFQILKVARCNPAEVIKKE